MKTADYKSIAKKLKFEGRAYIKCIILSAGPRCQKVDTLLL